VENNVKSLAKGVEKTARELPTVKKTRAELKRLEGKRRSFFEEMWFKMFTSTNTSFGNVFIRHLRLQNINTQLL